MKRWISLFVSFVVVFSAFSLTALATEDPVQDLGYEDLYVYASIVSSQTSGFTTEIPQQGQITDRRISQNYDQPYTKIKSLSFSCPASSYFFIDFDIVADDNQWNLGGAGQVTANRTFQQYSSSDISISSSVGGSGVLLRAEVRNYYVGGAFVHYSIFGLNNSLDYNNIVITYNNPVVCNSTLVQGTNYYYNQRITNVTCITSLSLDTITSLMDETLSLLGSVYTEIVSIGDTIDTFYSEFHANWNTLVNSYINRLWQLYSITQFYTVNLGYDNQGIGSITTGNSLLPTSITTSLKSIITYLWHHQQLENKAIEQGANDAYDDLSESA